MMKYSLIIVGGGASGLMLSAMLQNERILLLERGERLGRKLSATGNGQGNVTNLAVGKTDYFSQSAQGNFRVQRFLQTYGAEQMLAFLEGLGGLFLPDERGRVYPSGRQASAVTDLLRFSLSENTDVRFNAYVSSVQKTKDGFQVTVQETDVEKRYFAENVVLCAGGKAAKNFGTDGNGYALAKSLSHTVTPLYPSLVQLKTETKDIKGLKGLRVNGAHVSACVAGKTVAAVKGDVIFTDYGVSGDAIFRLSAFIADKIDKADVVLSIDFLPDVSEETLCETLQKRDGKRGLTDSERLCGIVNNQIGRAIVKRYGQAISALARGMKSFTLAVTGSLGFDYAQVTKGGVCLDEVDDTLQSRFVKGLYFAGEILDVDGECGGFNLQWAFTSAQVVANAIGRGQV